MPYDPTFSLLGIYANQQSRTYVYKTTTTFIQHCFINNSQKKQLKCPPKEKQLKKRKTERVIGVIIHMTQFFVRFFSFNLQLKMDTR